jgi:hypothetical protein
MAALACGHGDAETYDSSDLVMFLAVTHGDEQACETCREAATEVLDRRGVTAHKN